MDKLERSVKGVGAVLIIPVATVIVVLLFATAVVLAVTTNSMAQTSEVVISKNKTPELLSIYVYEESARNESLILVVNRGGTLTHVDYYTTIGVGGGVLSDGSTVWVLQPGESRFMQPSEIGLNSSYGSYGFFHSSVRFIALHTKAGGLYRSAYATPGEEELP